MLNLVISLIGRKTMEYELNEDFKQGRDLLEHSERTDDLSLKAKKFKEGIDILNECLRYNPNSEQKSNIENIKKSYTKILLEKLPCIAKLQEAIDIDIALSHAKKEYEIIINEYQDLKNKYDKFIELWLEEMLDYFLYLKEQRRYRYRGH